MTFISYVLKRYLCTEYFIKPILLLRPFGCNVFSRLCQNISLPRSISFFPFNCHVTALNLFNDRNCDVLAKVVRSAVVEKVF